MLGRAAYHNPWLLADPGKTRAQSGAGDVRIREEGEFLLRNVTRHMLGLYHGHRRARLWRRMLSEPDAARKDDPALLLEALEAVESRAMIAA